MEVVVRFFYYFVVSLLEVTKFYIIGRYILAWKTKEWTWKRIIVAGIGLIAIAFFFSIFLGRTNPFVVYVLFLLMENFVTFEECVWKIVCATMIEMYAISAIDIIVHGLYVVVLGGIGVDFQVPVKVLVSITTITFLGIVAYAMHYKLQCYIRKIPIRYYIIFIGLATGNGILLGEFGDVIEKGNMKICIAYIFIVLGVFLELALLLILAATREVYKEKDLLNQKYLKWQEEHYTYLEQRETATKKFRHDMRNHIYILQHLLKQEKLEEAKQYADELEEHFASVGTTISVNHGIVDAILNKYAAKCQEKKIGLVVKG